MAKGSWAYIQFVERPGGGHPDQGLPGWEGPVDPGWGIESGRPDQGLPGGRPPHVGNRPPGSGRPPHAGHLPSWGGRPVDPGWGVGSEYPDQGLPQPPHVWPRPPGGGLPVDPGWGVGEGHPDQGPVYPIDPAYPDNTLPPIPGIDPPPVDPPPGTVWPPLPDHALPEGGAKKAIVLAAIECVGYRYVIVEIKAGHPDQGLPGQPGHPDQGLPPTAQPKGLRR
jgi:hypothetical protein